MKKIIPIILILFLFIAIAIIKTTEKNQAITKPIQGIILPHHGLAKEILNESFKRLKDTQTPKTVVILGTNHYFPISETYTTTKEVKEGYHIDFVLADDARVKGDHSIQTIIPYINQYLPGTRIVPIIVSTRYTNIDILKSRVDDFVNKFGRENTLYIASVDFAHNVSLDEGIKNNTESIEAIKKFDINKILTFNDEHVDSPLALASLLLGMKSMDTTDWETWYSSHGALIVNSSNAEGTSYVVGVFR